ncbi:hypothetical protein BKA70DRAFT_367657 [Coprinopsis sp. MPI-PUGE-AT-0042]|nr:hypothetical protein BKA70DRAFT_367657 [Coprinopsis sp. MPI-PUGE-AT-0042]
MTMAPETISSSSDEQVNTTRHTALASSTSSTASHKSTYASIESTTPASASPFPSPSSSFLPPPTPGAHEFAVKPPPHLVKKASANAHLVNSGLGLGVSTAAAKSGGGGGGLNGHGKERSDEGLLTPIASPGGNVNGVMVNGRTEVGAASNVDPTLLSSSALAGSTTTTTIGGGQSHIAQQQQVYATTQNALTPREDVVVVGALGAPHPPSSTSTLTSTTTTAAPIVSQRTSSLRASTSASTLSPHTETGIPATPNTPTVASAARLSGSSHGGEWGYSPTTPTPSNLAFMMKGARGDVVGEGEKDGAGGGGGGSNEVTPSPSMFISPRGSSLATSYTTPASPGSSSTAGGVGPMPIATPTKRHSLLLEKVPKSPYSGEFGSPLTSSRPAPPSPALSATNLSWSPSGGGASWSPSAGGASPSSKRISKALSTSSQRSSDERERGERADGMSSLSRAGSKREKRFSQLSSSFTLPPALTYDEDLDLDLDGEVGPPPASAASAASTMSGTSTISAASGVSEASTVVVTPTPASPLQKLGGQPVNSSLTNQPSTQTLKTANLTSANLKAGTEGKDREKERERKVPRTTYTTIRDFAFGPDDVRYCGMGEDVPKSNRVERVNRALRGGWVRARKRLLEAHRLSTSSISSAYSTYSTYSNRSSTSSINSEEGEEEEDGGGGFGFGGGGWEGFQMRFGRMSWSAGFGAASSSTPPANSTSTTNGYPSRNDLDRNFFPDEEDYDVVDPEEDDYDDLDDEDEDGLVGAGEGEGGEEEELYPGIYRAMFAFEPEGTAEVALSEDQLVRVVGRGGGVGWAVVEVGWKASPGLVKELREMGADLGGLDDASLLDDSASAAGANGKGGPCANGMVGVDGGVDVTTKDGKVRHGLVPESYLTPVKLDGVVAATA